MAHLKKTCKMVKLWGIEASVGCLVLPFKFSVARLRKILPLWQNLKSLAKF